MPERIPKTTAEIGLLSSDHPDIVASAEIGYLATALEFGWPRRNIHRQRVCQPVSHYMRSALFETGYDANNMGRELVSGAQHQYLGLVSEHGLVLVDGTWQQFLPLFRKPPDLPKVLVGTPDEVVSFASDAGVRKYSLDFWRAEPSPKLFKSYVNGRAVLEPAVQNT